MAECDGRETENESFLFICEEKSQNFEKKRKILKADLIYSEIMKADKKRRDQKTRNRSKKGQATLDVPAAYGMWEMAWEDSSIDLDQWIEDYTIRRYGAYSENAVEAWMYLKDSVYSSSRGTVSNLMSQNPDLNLSLSKIKYSEADLEKAFLLLMKDYDVLSQSEGYLFDLEEIASQIIRNNQYSLLGEVRTAYNDKDLDAFAESKERLLDSFDLLDAIAQMSSSTLLGEWIGKAEDYAENYDDFSMDMFRINAKAMLTTWKNSVNTGLIDYAARNYNGLIKDVYKQVWSQYLDSLEENLRNGIEVEKANKYELYWAWVLDDKEYTRETLSDTVEIKALMEQVSEEMMSIDQDDLTYFAAAEANYEIASDGANGGYAKYAIDDSLSSYWDGGSVENEPTLIIDLKDDYHLDQIQVIVHPQSIIHSAVQYVDGAVIAQLGTPDMKLPIQYALFYPDRRPMPGKRLDFYELAQITFEKPDMETFFGLKLAYDAQRIGGSMPTVYNAANEKAVGLFLDRKIAYLQIPELIREAMEQHKVIENPNVEEILETEASVYDFIEKVYSERQ